MTPFFPGVAHHVRQAGVEERLPPVAQLDAGQSALAALVDDAGEHVVVHQADLPGGEHRQLVAEGAAQVAAAGGLDVEMDGKILHHEVPGVFFPAAAIFEVGRVGPVMDRAAAQRGEVGVGYGFDGHGSALVVGGGGGRKAVPGQPELGPRHLPVVVDIQPAPTA